jgi:hypothetical protein
MDTTVVVVLVAALVVIVLAVIVAQGMRGRALRKHFGPEYGRAVKETGDRHKAEIALAEREKRVKALELRPLAAGEQRSFIDSWRSVQAEFVDNPEHAIVRADQLLGDVMAVRGYPVSDFDRRAEDLSVDHPTLVHNYRIAHEVATRRGRPTTTEDLRQAMIHYRALFGELVDPREAETPSPKTRYVGDQDPPAMH